MHNQKFSKETIWAVSIIFVCVLTAFFLFIKMSLEKSHTGEFAVINETAILPEISNSIEFSNTTIPTDEPTSVLPEIEENNYHSPIDFESLWETNKDVYAWITIPGTVIDYPILQHETDNSYYLNYTIDGIEGYPGSIYTEKVNSKDFTDNNTVIYGHNMRNGTMFTDLHKFRDADFFADNDTIYIYTPEKQLTYKIFAAYLYDDRHLMNSFDFSDSEVYANYLTQILNMDSEDMNIRNELTVTENDKIITLITCIRERPHMRVYVQGVLQNIII